MNIKRFFIKETPTQKVIRESFPNLSQKKINKIDAEIRKSIANNDEPQKIQESVKAICPKNEKNKYKFSKICNCIIEEYTKNNKRWMLQENLFCFLALIVSVTSMIIEIIKQHYNLEKTFEDNHVSFIIYLIVLIVFLLIDGIYKKFLNTNNSSNPKKAMNKFDNFLKILNRYSPGLIILGTAIFYTVNLLFPINWVTSSLKVFVAVLPLFSIIKTLSNL